MLMKLTAGIIFSSSEQSEHSSIVKSIRHSPRVANDSNLKNGYFDHQNYTKIEFLKSLIYILKHQICIKAPLRMTICEQTVHLEPILSL
jgi:hypothetical protein